MRRTPFFQDGGVTLMLKTGGWGANVQLLQNQPSRLRVSIVSMGVKASYLLAIVKTSYLLAIVKRRYFLTNLFIQSCFLAMELSCFPLFCFMFSQRYMSAAFKKYAEKYSLIMFTSLIGANLQQTAVGTPLYFKIHPEGRTGETSWIPVDSINRDILSFKNHN